MQSTKSFNDLFEAGKSAKDNEYVQRLIQDEDLRNDALAALKSARKAFDRASNKNWDKQKIASDKKLRKDLQQAVTGLRDARHSLIDPPKRHVFRKLFALALIGVGIAIAMNPDARKAALDALFGAEEEFEYKPPATGSTNGSS